MNARNTTGKSAQVADIAITGMRDTNMQMCGISTKLAGEIGATASDNELVLVSGLSGSTLLRFSTFSQSRNIIGVDGITMKNLGVERPGDSVSVQKMDFEEVNRPERVELLIVSIETRDKEDKQNPEDVLESYKDMIESHVNGLTFVNGNMFFLNNGEYTIHFIMKCDDEYFIIDKDTKIEFKLQRGDVEGLTWDDIGGLDKEIDQVREIVELPIKYPELFERIRLDPPKGVILHGPPGTGKTMMGKALSTLLGFNLYFIDGGLWGGSPQTPAELQRLFEMAKKNAPSIIFIDELDALAPKRDSGGRGLSGNEIKIVATLLTEMDGTKKNEGVIVIGATNRINAIDNALRRHGRFGEEVAIGVPDEEGRKDIIKIHLRGTPLKDVDEEAINKIATMTHGFVGADIAGMIRKAKFQAIRKVVPDIDKDADITPKKVEELKLKKSYMKRATRKIKPSALREFLVEVPKVKWKHIGGAKEEQMLLKESVILPLTKPEKFKEIGVKAPSGIMLYGPPGCGKTLLAKAVATESNSNFISIKGPELLSMWVGETERAVRELFNRARQVSPCVIFIDEADTVGRSRGTQGVHDHGVSENMLSQFLTEMDGIEAIDGIVIIMATNRPDIMDPALMRPGRIDRFIYVSPPDEEGRLEIFKVHTKKMKLCEKGDGQIDFETLVNESGGYSGADIESTCREAGMIAIREDADCVTMSHFSNAFEKVGGSLTKEMLNFYEKVAEGVRKRKHEIRDQHPFTV